MALAKASHLLAKIGQILKRHIAFLLIIEQTKKKFYLGISNRQKSGFQVLEIIFWFCTIQLNFLLSVMRFNRLGKCISYQKRRIYLGNQCDLSGVNHNFPCNDIHFFLFLSLIFYMICLSYYYYFFLILIKIRALCLRPFLWQLSHTYSLCKNDLIKGCTHTLFSCFLFFRFFSRGNSITFCI
jgi:hypothetical protein